VRGLDTSSFPVDSVTWEDAAAFCAALSRRSAEKKAGRTYRLPTEAEWEYACRAGTTWSAPFHFGESLSSRQANFDGSHPYGGAMSGPSLGRTCPVGSYPPNAYGLYDMHGNVWEWCADWFDVNYYPVSPTRDPAGPDEGHERVLRGGSFFYIGSSCRAAIRFGRPIDEPSSLDGFRVAMSIGHEPEA
jgi:formylglycine-generating enzyme required for sulfatase activity